MTEHAPRNVPFRMKLILPPPAAGFAAGAPPGWCSATVFFTNPPPFFARSPPDASTASAPPRSSSSCLRSQAICHRYPRRSDFGGDCVCGLLILCFLRSLVALRLADRDRRDSALIVRDLHSKPTACPQIPGDQVVVRTATEERRRAHLVVDIGAVLHLNLLWRHHAFQLVSLTSQRAHEPGLACNHKQFLRNLVRTL